MERWIVTAYAWGKLEFAEEKFGIAYIDLYH